MGERSYYLILGVAPDESAAGIHSAYRALARRFHPDVQGSGSTPTFQDIEEAYRVLSHPRSRREYDEQMEQRAAGISTPAGWSSDLGHGGEPLAWDLGSLWSVRDSIRPSFEAVYDRFLRNFTGRGIRKSERVESLDFDLVLTADEAARGGFIRVPVPVFVACPACRGTGYDWLLPCVACGRQGVVERGRPVPIDVPPMTGPGTIIEVPLQGLGIHNFFLRLRVSVEA